MAAHTFILITDAQQYSVAAYLQLVSHCIENGVTSVQLRAKQACLEEQLHFGKILHTHLKKRNIPLIVNDNLTLAKALDAEGLHLGQTDGDVIEARAVLGEQKYIGLSTSSIAEVIAANSLPLNYIGFGAIFPTMSKTDAPITGLSALVEAAHISKHPIVAIGGICLDNVSAVLHAGAAGIAVISALHQTPSVADTAHRFAQLIQENYYAHQHSSRP